MPPSHRRPWHVLATVHSSHHNHHSEAHYAVHSRQDSLFHLHARLVFRGAFPDGAKRQRRHRARYRYRPLGCGNPQCNGSLGECRKWIRPDRHDFRRNGQFEFPNVPFNPYRISVSAKGFAPLNQNVEIRSSVGTNVKLTLQVAGGSQTVTVEASGDLVENDPTFHTDVDRDLFIKVPLESQSSSLSSLVTLTTPGVAADSNGLFHGLGDHASNSFSVDGQSITDQQSKVFSNQLPSNSIQSIEVISGAPPAEYGGKTSLVIVATTRSGQGVTKPTGSISSSYGTFGSATAGFDLSYGGKNWGNFIEADGLNTGRFLDPPEFAVFHDKGNEEERLRPHRLHLHAGRLDAPGPELQPLVVPEPQFLRQPERPERGQRRHQRQPRLRQRRQHRPALQDRHLQHLAHLHPRRQQRLGRSTLAPLSARTSTTTIPAAIRWPTWARQPADLVDLPEPHA